MGSFSIWHWLIVLVIVLVLFGRGRVSEIMGDFGKGIKSFKQGMNDESGKDMAKDLRLEQSADAAPAATETKTAEVKESEKKA